jgi:hypothetical protein
MGKLIALLLTLSWSAGALAEEGGVWEGRAVDWEEAGADTDEFKRPKFGAVRYFEDWSVLADGAPPDETDPFDPVKYIGVQEEKKIWISIGGQVRGRVEAWHDFAFGSPSTPHETYGLARYRIHADVHATEYVRGFLEIKSAFCTDRDLPGGERTLDVDEFAFQNAFVEGKAPLGDMGSVLLRLGRQELIFGKQRLVSPLDWSNTRRTWDGFRVDLDIKGWKASLFWTQFVPVDRYEIQDIPDHRHRFYGVHVEGKPWPDGELNVYWLSHERGGPIWINGTWGGETRHTVGLRIGGKAPGGGLDFDFETAGQFGSLGGEDINAYMAAAQLGYNLPGSAKHRLWAAVDYASGDLQPGGGVETFSHIYPLGHAYLGFIDIIGRQNIVAFSAGAKLELPLKGLSAVAAGHLFYRAHDNDSLYSASAGIVRWGFGTEAMWVGGEVDLVLKYAFDTHLLCMLGYSQFYPGGFVYRTGTARETRFGYLQVQYTF